MKEVDQWTGFRDQFIHVKSENMIETCYSLSNYTQRTGNINPKYEAVRSSVLHPYIRSVCSFSYQGYQYRSNKCKIYFGRTFYHESGLQTEEHYTITARFIDHVFTLVQLSGFKFAPRIRDLNEKKLFVPKVSANYSVLSEHIGGTINGKKIIQNWAEILRLSALIKNGTVIVSLIVKKIGSYLRQNGLAVTLRGFGKIERTLFMFD